MGRSLLPLPGSKAQLSIYWAIPAPNRRYIQTEFTQISPTEVNGKLKILIAKSCFIIGWFQRKPFFTVNKGLLIPHLLHNSTIYCYGYLNQHNFRAFTHSYKTLYIQREGAGGDILHQWYILQIMKRVFICPKILRPWQGENCNHCVAVWGINLGLPPPPLWKS
jgi:hypothetical protein